MLEYAGLDISQAALAHYVPSDVLSKMGPIAAITRKDDRGMSASAIHQGVREVKIERDGDGIFFIDSNRLQTPKMFTQYCCFVLKLYEGPQLYVHI